ncbi:MAG: DUF1223 domain-containing protein [Pseudomonadota bacterium]
MFARVFGIALVAASFFGGASVAAGPVVVELYTSQGCSSCPPADALLHELKQSEDVLPLAFHVDYWDYIGWVDHFADPAHTERQKGYARAAGERMIYTPQMIIGGVTHVIGNRHGEVAPAVAAAKDAPEPVRVSALRRGNSVEIAVEPVARLSGPVIVQWVEYNPAQTVDIRRGENAGRSLTYHNVVTRFEILARWNGSGTYRGRVNVDGSSPGAVIVQYARHGAVLGATRVE